MKKVVVTLIALTAVASGGAAFAAGDPVAGKTKSAICAACHGVTGISHQDIWPNLAQQRAAYLAKQLRDFRDGRRKDAVMEAMAKILTDQDVNDLAAFYAVQPSSPPQSKADAE